MSEVSLTGWMKALIAYVRSGEPDPTPQKLDEGLPPDR